MPLQPVRGAAVAASSVVVLNVQGNDAAGELLESVGEAVAGRTVVNLTDGTSEQARGLATWAADNGAEYLHG